MALPALLLGAVAAATTIAAPVEPAPRVVSWSVDAGTTGALVEDHRAPTVKLRVEFPVGTWSPWARAHHAEEAFEYQNDDPDRALENRADALGIAFSLDMQDRRATVHVTCLRRDLDAVLALVKDVLSNARYDEKEMKRRNRERSIAWRGTETDVPFRLGQAVSRTLFRDPEDPRRRAWEKPEPMETDSRKLAAARDALIRFPGRVVGFAGDLTEAEARKAAKTLLPEAAAGVPPDVVPRLGALAPASERPKEQSIPIRKLTQVYFAYGRDSLPWTDPRRPAFLVADQVLGGSFYSRLYVALRHDSGETYGASTRERGTSSRVPTARALSREFRTRRRPSRSCARRSPCSTRRGSPRRSAPPPCRT